MRAPGEEPDSSGAGPQGPPADQPLVAFDFDGTLTTRDSFTAFLRWRTNRRTWALGLLRLAPAALAYLATRDRGKLKSKSIEVFLSGLPQAALEAEAEAFETANGDALLRPDALAAWTAHKAAGARLVIVTASPEDVVAPFARRLGADALVGSRLARTADGRVGRSLAGANCRGEEKVRRLRERFGPSLRLSDAYGDTSGDREMLAIAERGRMKVFTQAP